MGLLDQSTGLLDPQIQSLIQQFLPTDADKQNAQNQALLAMSSGLLANSMKGFGPALGMAGQGGQQAYQQGLMQGPQQKQAALQQAMEAAKLQQMISMPDMSNMNPDQLDALGARLAMQGHPGASTVMHEAERRRAKIADLALTSSMKSQPAASVNLQDTPLAGMMANVPQVPQGAPVSDPNVVSQQAQPGALSGLFSSPYVGARAKQLQTAIDSSNGALPATSIEKQIGDLYNIDQKYTQSQQNAAALAQARKDAQNQAFLNRQAFAATSRANKPDASESASMMLQDRDSGAKYLINNKTGQAWKYDANGDQVEINPNDIPSSAQKIGAGIGIQAGREAVFNNRIITSANEAAKDLDNVVKLPMSSSSGLFGGREQGTSLMGATKEVLANTMTTQEVQSYNVMATGFQRSLATIEASGLMPSGSLTHQMDAVIFKEGDTNLTKLQKLAQTRQIVDAGLEVVESNPRVTEQEKKKIQEIRARMNSSVPFTQQDLMQFMNSNQNVTLGQILKMKNTQKSSDILNQADAILGNK